MLTGKAAYPVGGASEITRNIVSVIEKNGGKVLVRAGVRCLSYINKNTSLPSNYASENNTYLVYSFHIRAFVTIHSNSP